MLILQDYRPLTSKEDNNDDYKQDGNLVVIFKIIKYIIIHISLSIVLNTSKYLNLVYIDLNQKVPQEKESNMKIALCTMGKLENLYANEFVEYHLKLGIDHIFIYDDNDPNTERIIDVIDDKSKSKVTSYENIKGRIHNQSEAFTECYHNNSKDYDWFLMIDMDEFLFIKNDTLKHYLSNYIFDKCDFIKFHWVYSYDNDLIYYDTRPLLERFKPPYLKNIFVKTIIRSKIPKLLYGIHSPLYSPIRNITCTNIGEIVDTSKRKNLDVDSIGKINIDKALIIHFRYKTAEELVIKQKRGYSDWCGDILYKFLDANIAQFFIMNRLTMEKINYIEKELNLTLTKYKLKYYFRKLFFMN